MIQSFSVIVPVFNKENEIVRSLESIEASIQFFYQNYASGSVKAEVIIVNEGSTDRTLERITDFTQNKPNYQIIHHFKSLGAGAARNTGARISQGDVLFFCDGDDLVFQEHFYLCFMILSYQPSLEAPTSFVLQSDRSTYTIELPKHSVGMVRTGVFMKDPLHPYWKTAIENTLPQNLGIRRECHEFVEGFPEAPIYKQIGCEDISYVLWTSKFFKLLKIDLETVEYIRYPGNNFDRQLKKFQTPPDQYQEDTPLEKRELHNVRHQLEQERLNYLFDKFKRTQKTSEFLAITNWQQLASNYLSQQQYGEVVTLCEQGLAAEPTAIDNLRNLLAVTYNNLGSEYHKKENLQQAVHYFKQAIEVRPAFSDPDLARLHFNIGTVLKDQESYEQALNFLKQALALDPHLKEALAILPIVKYKADVAGKEQKFTQDWFSHNIPIWQQHLSRFVGQAGLKVLEIGSWEGRSTCWLIYHILTHTSARITCIDTFAGGIEHEATFDQNYLGTIEERFDFNIARTTGPKKVRKIVGKSHEVLRSLPLNNYHWFTLMPLTLPVMCLKIHC